MQTQGKLTLLVSGFGELLLLPPPSALASGWLHSSVLMTFTLTFLSLAIHSCISSCCFLKPDMRKAEPQLFLLKSHILLLFHFILITTSFHSNVEAFCNFFFPTSNLIGCSQVSKCISLQNSFHSVVQYCLECYKLNLQKTYSLISIHLPLVSNAFRCSHPLFKSIFLIFTSEAHSSCSSRPAYLQSAGKARHHSSPIITLHDADVSFAPTLFCTDGARCPYSLF